MNATRKCSKYEKRKCREDIPFNSPFRKCAKCRASDRKWRKAFEKTPVGAAKRRKRVNASFAKIRSQLRDDALCVHHRIALPCMECSLDRQVKLLKKNGRPSGVKCGVCSVVGHRRDSYLCPLRFRVDVDEYASARTQ